MSNPELPLTQKEKGTLKYFERHRTIAATWSVIAFAAFLFITYITVPLFFTNFWLAPILLVLLVATRQYGSWDAYAKMRKQTNKMQEDLDNISKAVEKIK